MKKQFSLLLLISTCFLFLASCKKPKHETNKGCEPLYSGCYKGRLEIKGMCGNYTIKVLNSNIPSNLVQNTWTDPFSNKNYQNVFALSNPCDFPSSLNEGDEFYFSITKGSKNNCYYCAGYYPTPDTTQDINVLSTPCNKTSN